MTNDTRSLPRWPASWRSWTRSCWWLRDGQDPWHPSLLDQFANIVLEGAVERIRWGAATAIPSGCTSCAARTPSHGRLTRRETEGLTAVDNDELKREEAEKASEKLKGEMLSRMDFDLDRAAVSAHERCEPASLPAPTRRSRPRSPAILPDPVTTPWRLPVLDDDPIAPLGARSAACSDESIQISNGSFRRFSCEGAREAMMSLTCKP